MPALAGVTPKLKGDGGKVHKAPPIAKRLVGSPPISRVLSWATIPLGPPLPTASSSLPGSDAGRANAPLFGLAPDGVCHAVRVATSAVSSYLAISPLPVLADLGGIFLLHFPSPSSSNLRLPTYSARPLAGILPCGARTFLQPLS